MLSVQPDSRLPSMHRNVWSAYDDEGWDESIERGAASQEPGEPMSDDEINALRIRLQSALTHSAKLMAGSTD